jgi:hypothetical protein
MITSSKEEDATTFGEVKNISPNSSGDYLPKPVVGGSNPLARFSVLYDEPITTYHGDLAHVGSTQIRLAESATVFHDAVEMGGMPDSKSAALQLGSAWHTLREIGYDPFCERAITAPEEHCTASGGLSTKKATKDWLATLPPDAIILSPEMGEILGKMQDRFGLNPKAVELEEDILHREASIRWESTAGVMVRCRPDFVGNNGQLGDYKTTSEKNILKDWSRSVRTYGYGISAALYEQGAVVSGLAEPPMHFIVTQTVHPYLTQVVTLPPVYMDWARRRLDELLTDIARRRATGDWIEDGYGIVNELTMPGFGDRVFSQVE